MITIFKYPLQITDTQSLMLPDGAIIRHVGLDPTGRPCLWAQVDAKVEDFAPIEVNIVGTGNPAPTDAAFVGTFLQPPFVWHVFTRELPRPA